MQKTNNSLLSRIIALVAIAPIVIAALFFLFKTDMTAAAAAELSKRNAEKLEHKADRDDLKDGFREINDRLDKQNQRLDKLNEYLLRRQH